ncbi:hypothetical protein MANES_13G088677v8 [Manihot esculenta]|uniref:Uncharacterized protein n=2 Tax=Manihot esculenta TaxID=3983 RepID=A0ACB7GN67_MANES|nr:hypothetical protein MANES_13G088677v8 [Manihot esculenta]
MHDNAKLLISHALTNLYKFHKISLLLHTAIHNSIIMSSIGAACAEVYLMRKKQKEKLKKAEEERRRNGGTQEIRKVGGAFSSSGGVWMNKKIYPGNYFPGNTSQGKQAE